MCDRKRPAPLILVYSQCKPDAIFHSHLLARPWSALRPVLPSISFNCPFTATALSSLSPLEYKLASSFTDKSGALSYTLPQPSALIFLY